MPSRSTTCGGIAERLLAQGASGIRQRDVEGALVAGAALPREVALRLEPLQQRRQRRGLELQRLAEVAHRARAALPEREHHEVLRMGEAERLEDRAVDADHAACRDREREADLVLEGEQVVGCRGRDGRRLVASTRSAAWRVVLVGPWLQYAVWANS